MPIASSRSFTPRSEKTFSQEQKALAEIPGIFWGYHAEYETVMGRPYGVLVSQDSQENLDDVGNSPDGFVVSGHHYSPVFDEIYTAAKDGRRGELGEVFAETTGIDLEKFFDSLRGATAGGSTADLKSEISGIDAFGWYLPWHAYHASAQSPWGIYLSLDGLLDWMTAVWFRHRNRVGEKRPEDLLRLLIMVVYGPKTQKSVHAKGEERAICDFLSRLAQLAKETQTMPAKAAATKRSSDWFGLPFEGGRLCFTCASSTSRFRRIRDLVRKLRTSRQIGRVEPLGHPSASKTRRTGGNRRRTELESQS